MSYFSLCAGFDISSLGRSTFSKSVLRPVVHQMGTDEATFNIYKIALVWNLIIVSVFLVLETCFTTPVVSSNTLFLRLFGTPSSSYQFEGAFMSDGKGLNSWDVFSHKAGCWGTLQAETFNVRDTKKR